MEQDAPLCRQPMLISKAPRPMPTIQNQVRVLVVQRAQSATLRRSASQASTARNHVPSEMTIPILKSLSGVVLGEPGQSASTGVQTIHLRMRQTYVQRQNSTAATTPRLMH